MKTLLYLSFGQGPYTEEVIFSILSAYHLGGPNLPCRILIYTDTPHLYEGINATVVVLTPQQLEEWAGPTQFSWRRKIVALQHAIAAYDSPTVIMDGDTYFIRPPNRLFHRLAPGRSLMHVKEGMIGDLIALGPLRTQIPGQSFTLADGTVYSLATQAMWNAGVVGVHPADAKMLDEVLELVDAMQAQHPDRLSEQTALGAVLGRRTRLLPCRDIIFHYHQAFIRDNFRKQLPALAREWKSLPLQSRAQKAYDYRPIPTFDKRAKAALKRLMKPLAYFRSDLETSV